MGQLVLLGVGVFDVTDRARQTLHEGRNALVALTAETDGPLYGRAFADLLFPVSADLGQVVAENEGRTGTIGTTNHADVLFRKLDVGVQFGDRLVVPLEDLAHVDVGQNGTRQFQLARLDICKVDHRHDAANDRRELDQTVLFQDFRLQRHVGSAEIDRLGRDLLDAATGTDRLIVDAVVRRLLVGIGPLGVDRRRERSARAGDFGGLYGKGNRRCHDGKCKPLDRFHMLFS